MPVAGCNALYRNTVKSALQPRVRPATLRTLTTTGRNGYDRAPQGGSPFDLAVPSVPPPNPHAREIAILGGGLTGLATAYHLSREIPKAKITIYEKNARLGGWIDSETVKVDNGDVLFEWGPRTIRCAPGIMSSAMLEMVCDLDLTNDLVAISKEAAAARNRYLYYPDRLVKMPAPLKGASFSDFIESVRTVLTEPLFERFWNIFKEPWTPLRDENVKDEPLGDFISRRFGKEVANNIASAFFHGVYAGDIYQLSARTLATMMWHLESRNRDEKSSILLEVLADRLNRRGIARADLVRHRQRFAAALNSPDAYLRRVPNPEIFDRLSVYTFKHGLAQLTSALEQRLRQTKNITILESTAVEEVTFEKAQDRLRVGSKSSPAASVYDYVVSTLGPRSMQQFFLSNNPRNPAGTTDERVNAACQHSNKSVNVMVINLYYDNPDLLSIRGFGYLIPRSVPVEQNPERALGVLFGSETSGRFDSVNRRSSPPFYIQREWDKEKGQPVVRPQQEPYDGPDIVHQDTAPGTKLTVMMGGHWWNEWADSDLPTEKQAIEMAQTLLKRHLNIDERPTVAKARLNRNCIPQPPVGYAQDMATIHDALLSKYKGRLKVLGPWWQGAPGMNDCVRVARETAWAIRDHKDELTGLQNYMRESFVVTHLPTRQATIEYTE
ncbi:protoporphyrinogen oxidase [Cladophialophora yegresii CBS 114405]|uniref:Protoporphyrinogen oxidase n=1 Tax=Cladophialophora yegresii CBS 114405 TaxID=1182544 RepID=W9VER7_9EURO|nr:protoporphyrinogen oxidase [Cladophialophora yegresii CBS 114405]EXJ54117.1 protoporphyrinogen oxidase [Cladophialophora yegresii CBS 114405]